jgi:Fe-S oxidoreductase
LLAVPTLDTVFDFGEDGGIVQAAERCNGSGDCRKLSAMGGTMCPSFRATRNEIDSTRARANLLRDVLTRSSARNRFDSKELKEAFDLCLLCKACKSECPSGVDVAKLKMEFLQQYRASHGGDLRSFLVAYLPVLNRWVVHIPKVYNYLIHNILVKNWVLSPLGFSAQRSLPKLVQSELPKAMKARRNTASATVCLFVDEFAEYHDPDIALSAIAVLEAVGFRVVLPKHVASGRTYLSKGYLLKAKELAVKNVTLLSAVVRADLPLVGIEPSAILAFRDEYPDLLRSVSPDLYAKAQFLAQHSFTFEEFLLAKASDLVLAAPSAARIQVLYHGHCQQKALVKKNTTVQMLRLFDEIEVREIASGCCGMAGSFGFEKEHYEVSMKIGEETLFPEVRNAAPEVVIAASGTSCRHQIADGTGRIAIHPIQLVHRILIARRMVQFKA